MKNYKPICYVLKINSSFSFNVRLKTNKFIFQYLTPDQYRYELSDRALSVKMSWNVSQQLTLSSTRFTENS